MHCVGCSWDGYTHHHNDAEDGPRRACCAHTCGKDAPTYPVSRTAPRVPSGSRCKNCGYDLRGMYGSDRQAHKDGWCRD